MDHLTSRLHGEPYSFDAPMYTDEVYDHILVQDNRLYFQKSIHFNYTTYACQRQQDVVKPFLIAKRTTEGNTTIQHNSHQHSFIMLASSEDNKIAGDHPFWYASVISIFHVWACEAKNQKQLEFKRVPILWVRWLGREAKYKSGVEARRLDKVGFVEDQSSDYFPFGFLDPQDVI
jgi:hypothetical protein